MRTRRRGGRRPADGVAVMGTGRRTDVVVVGAGPAGSAAAWSLARAGARVRILDARTFPRSKPCGDALSPGASPLLEEMGVLPGLADEGAARIDGWRIRAQDGTWFEGGFRDPGAPAPGTGFALPRERLDALLLDAAVRAGAEFLAGFRVYRLLRNGGRVGGVAARGPGGAERPFPATYVVGADGLRSRLARLLGGVRRGRRRRLALVRRYGGLERGSRRGELRLTRDGVLGMAPLGGGRWNVTAVVGARRAAAISRDSESFFRDRLIEAGIRDRIAGGRPLGALEVTGPFEVSPERSAVPGAVLAGDAAGYFDPLTGQGVYHALLTGRLAAAAVARVFEEPAAEADALRRYGRELRRVLGPAHRVQRLVDAVVTRSVLMAGAARLLARRPGLADLLVDVTGDRLPPGALTSTRRLAAAVAGGGRGGDGRAGVERRGAAVPQETR